MGDTIIGIDLGTTNSEVAVIQDKQPVLIKNDKNVIFPSYVGLDPDGKLLVGEAARNQYPIYPDRTVKSVKRLMGTDKKVQMGKREYTPQEISAIILKSLKKNAESHLGESITKAVITVPAYFSDIQRKATREAGEIAGFEYIKIINEPTAAAMAYEGSAVSGKTIMVYDLGGGTFDVSIVHIEEGVIEVIASHGDNHLGGDDFDNLIVEYIEKELEKQHGTLSLSSEARARLTRAAEQAKFLLSDNPFAVIREEYLSKKKDVPIHLSLEISRDTYEEMIAPLVEETLKAIHTALQSANLTTTDIEEILLVGGSTRTPYVQQCIEQEFGVRPHCEVNPDLCVVSGAAIQAGVIGGEDVSAVLVDITPYTFSTSTLDIDEENFSYNRICVPLIKKNSPIPNKKSEVFYTMHENQKRVEITVYQGEDIDPDKNIRIGAFMVNDLSRVPGGSEIIITFDLDTDGILQVTATEKCTGKSKEISIDNAIGHFDEKDMANAKDNIIQLFGEDEDNEIKENNQESGDTVPADIQELLQKVAVLMETAEPEDGEELIELSETIRDAVQSGNKKEYTQAASELKEIIFYMES